MDRKYLFLAFISAALFAVSVPASKLMLRDLHPIFLAALFYLGAAIILLPFSFHQFPGEINHLKKSREDRKRIFGSVVFGGILGPVFLLFGIKYMEATGASLLLNLETVATTLLAWMIFKEHIGRKLLLSSALTIVAGVLLVVEKDLSLNYGGLLVIMACLCWGMDNNFTATIEGISPNTNTIIKGIFGGVFNLIVVLFISFPKIEVKGIMMALLVGSIAYGLSISLYIKAARKVGAARSQIIFATNPFLGSFLSYLIFSDKLDIRYFAAAAIMILALAILYRERHLHDHEHPEIEHEHEHTHDDNHHFHDHEENSPKVKHSHLHRHNFIRHMHPHYPDLHHRHGH